MDVSWMIMDDYLLAIGPKPAGLIRPLARQLARAMRVFILLMVLYFASASSRRRSYYKCTD